MPMGWFDPEAPDQRTVASRRSLASMMRPRTSASMFGQSIPISMENGTNARAVRTSIDGCARVGASSDTSAASASNDAVTPAELTPFHWSVVICTVRANWRIALTAPVLVRMIVGSSVKGTAKPPALPVSEAARDMASRSTSLSP